MRTIILFVIISTLALGSFAQVTVPPPAPTEPTQPTQPPEPSQPGYFFDIRTGQPLIVRYDTINSSMYNIDNDRQIDFFLNRSGDTVSANGFYIVNNYLSMQENSYRLDTSRASWREKKLWGGKAQSELKKDSDWKLYQESFRQPRRL